MELDQTIQAILKRKGFSKETAKYFAAVSRHETGNYTSSVLKSAKNLFGMKHPKVRQTTSLYADHSGYAVYTSPVSSVDDLVLYLLARKYPKHFNSVADLVTFMKSKSYFEDDLENYIAGVERALPKVK